MNRRNMLAISAVTSLGLALLAGGATGQPKAKIEKSQLVGDWALVSVSAPNAAVQNGPNDGFLVFGPSGRFSFALLNAKVPKFASNNRNTGTADENKAAVQGNIAYFGTYSVNEADNTFTFHIERSSYPNWTGTDQRRLITSLTAEELKYTNPSASIGGTAELVWKRSK
jgi:lipocalin-like protein